LSALQRPICQASGGDVLKGIINMLKPAGMTSSDGVYFLRRLTGQRKIGHAGTLDPMAAGVLPLCIGRATRIIDYLDLDKKEYRCEMQLGIATDTWDIWGKITECKTDCIRGVTVEDVEEVLSSFLGEIYQMPPMYSSVRIKGKHLYEYARKNQKVEVKKRPVIIYDMRLVGCSPSSGRILFDVVCSKGTYIRSICHEAGEILGCGASMSFLLRKGSGSFLLQDAVTIEDLNLDWKRYLLPADYPLQHLGRIDVPKARRQWFCNGGYLRPKEIRVVKRPSFNEETSHIKIRGGLERAYRAYCDDEFLGMMLYNQDEGIFASDKVFCR
jgi:tRNA pseudouridine55 synthase